MWQKFSLSKFLQNLIYLMYWYIYLYTCIHNQNQTPEPWFFIFQTEHPLVNAANFTPKYLLSMNFRRQYKSILWKC